MTPIRNLLNLDTIPNNEPLLLPTMGLLYWGYCWLFFLYLFRTMCSLL